MAVPNPTEIRFRDGSVQATYFVQRLHKLPYPYTSFCLKRLFLVMYLFAYTHRMMSGTRKDIGVGLPVLSLYNMSCLHNAIPASSFCGVWHSHASLYMF